MSKRVQARKDNKAATIPPVKDDKMESMQQTIQELQAEISKLKASIAEEKIARRDQLLMENLRELRQKKQKGIWNRVVQFAFNR